MHFDNSNDIDTYKENFNNLLLTVLQSHIPTGTNIQFDVYLCTSLLHSYVYVLMQNSLLMEAHYSELVLTLKLDV